MKTLTNILSFALKTALIAFIVVWVLVTQGGPADTPKPSISFPHGYYALISASGSECRSQGPELFCHAGKACLYTHATSAAVVRREYRAHDDNEGFVWCGKNARGWK